MRKWPYLSSWVRIKKTKVTLLSQTLKVEEKKVSLFFWFVTQELRNGHFIFWTSVSEVRIIVKGRKCQYLCPWAINKKTKDTLLSQTLKVEEKKVSLFFSFGAQEPNMAILSFEPQDEEYVPSSREKGQYVGPWAINLKMRTLYFLKL